VARGFTDKEKADIEERLLARGRELFARYGLDKTTVEELAQAAGIAKGTFYRFFPSKEALFGEVLVDEMPRMLDKLLSRSFGATADVREALVRYMKELVHLIESDVLARAVVSDAGLQTKVLAELDLRNMRGKRAEVFSPLAEAIAEAQQAGDLVSGEPMEIAQILGAIKIFPLYKEHMPPEQYPRLVERLAQVIADGLTCPVRAEVH